MLGIVTILLCNMLKGKMYDPSSDRVLLVQLRTNYETSPL